MTKPSPTLPRMMSIAELAARLGVSTKTVRRTIAFGDLRCHRLGRQIRISEEDALSYIAAHRQ